jgi:hypothetical protein
MSTALTSAGTMKVCSTFVPGKVQVTVAPD